MRKYVLFIAAYLTILSSCSNEPTFSEIPRIEFISLTKNFYNQATPGEVDSTEVSISWEDGDGDIGGDSLAITVIDTRTDNVESQFRVLEIPINGLKGEFDFPIFATCCIYEGGQPPCTPSNPVIEQEVIYEVFIKDRAENESNRILLPSITLRCQ